MPKTISMIPPIIPMTFWALSDANNEEMPNHAMKTIDMSDSETPRAR